MSAPEEQFNISEALSRRRFVGRKGADTTMKVLREIFCNVTTWTSLLHNVTSTLMTHMSGRYRKQLIVLRNVATFLSTSLSQRCDYVVELF